MISKEELKDEKFWGRLSRAGLSESKTNIPGGAINKKGGGKKKNVKKS